MFLADFERGRKNEFLRFARGADQLPTVAQLPACEYLFVLSSKIPL
jgi:hypothetical protein